MTGASRGLGAIIAKALAADGWSVAINYASDEQAAERVVADIQSTGKIAMAARFNVTDAETIDEGLAAIAGSLGPVDLIVNNATGPQPMMPIEEQSWDIHLAQLNFFVKAPLLLLQAVLADWRERGSGRVINIGSEVTDIGNAHFAHYVSAKSAMLGLTRSWARELGEDGITVNLIAPGFIPVERHRDVPSEALDAYRKDVPLGRMGSPEDIAGMVGYLASSRADFITGQHFNVNGGRTF